MGEVPLYAKGLARARGALLRHRVLGIHRATVES